MVEAKDNNHPVGGGMQQALAYAETLDVPFVFSSNGDAFFPRPHGPVAPRRARSALDEFPSPDELWSRYRAWKGLTDDAEKLVRFPYHEDGSGKEPRYYQRIAIQRTVEAIARGQRRVLLVMATGTGKTYTAFQIIWRLWKAGTVKRVLFLADRNILVDQTITNDFKPFGAVMTKVQHRTVDKSYEVYLALYQAVSGTEEEKNVYKQFSPDFFDLVVIDECHRGSAREDSAWREILDYFEPAIQLGLTATPKETRDVSTLTYFGEPVYTYSLKQGIDDGFLAPYKVVRIDLDKDLQGWRPPTGHARTTSARRSRTASTTSATWIACWCSTSAPSAWPRRSSTTLLAPTPTARPLSSARTSTTPSGCARRSSTRSLPALPSEAPNTAKFVVRITGDNDEGKRALDDFIHPERRYPVIATTSKLLTTGVDARTCKLIVLDQRIESMIEFKQTVGRGTRIHEEAGKLWFTIMDFKKATELFADPDFDGEPVVIYEPDSRWLTRSAGHGADGDRRGRHRRCDTDGDREVRGERRRGQHRCRARPVLRQGRQAHHRVADATTPRSAVQEHYASLDDFLQRWTAAERKQADHRRTARAGRALEELRDQVGKDLDAFDLICHVVYDRPPLTRRERAEQVRKRDVFTKYGAQARAVLDALLDKYANEGLVPVEDWACCVCSRSRTSARPSSSSKAFGGRDGYLPLCANSKRRSTRSQA